MGATAKGNHGHQGTMPGHWRNEVGTVGARGRGDPSANIDEIRKRTGSLSKHPDVWTSSPKV